MRKIWTKLPFGFRSLVHRLLHRFNTSEFLLGFFSFRHFLTVKRLKSVATPSHLRIGESRSFEGWISTNYQVITKHYLDATKAYGNAVCKYVFADNVIEHLDLQSGEHLIARAWDALIPGGMLRLTTPDLESIVKRYLIRSNVDVTQFSEDLREHDLDIRNATDFIRITFTKFGHDKGYIYDFETLSGMLEEKGFIEIRKFVPGESDNPELRNLETRTKPSDMWSQMAVEALKPKP